MTSDQTVGRFQETPTARSISQSGNRGIERSLWRLHRTCCCNLNLYFWGELFLTLWPCHAHWTLTMTDLSSAFLPWSLAQEWATGIELLCRPDRSSFLYVWVPARLLRACTPFFFVRCQNVSPRKLPETNFYFLANWEIGVTILICGAFLYSVLTRHHISSIRKCPFFLGGPSDCQKKTQLPWFPL